MQHHAFALRLKRLALSLFLLLVLSSQIIIAQEYRITVKDVSADGVDMGYVVSARVTFGDSTKYTDSAGVAVFYNPAVGVEEERPREFRVSSAYPNPTRGEDKVSVDVESRRAERLTAEIYDGIGRVVAKATSEITSGGEYTVELSGIRSMANGVYFLRISDGKHTETTKITHFGGSVTASATPRFRIYANARSFGGKSSSSRGKDAYIPLHVEKEGYAPIDERVEPTETEVAVNLTRSGKTFAGVIFELDAMQTLEGYVKAYFNGGDSLTVATNNKRFDMIIPAEELDSLKACGGEGTYSTTLTEIDLTTDVTRAGIPVVSYDSLSAIDVSPELFYAFVKEVATKRYRPNGGYTGKSHIVSIDFPKASLGFENGGYTYWIDRNDAWSIDPTSYDSLSVEEQEFVKEIIINYFYDAMQDTTHMPKIYLAEPGEIPPRRSSGSVVRGIFFITHNRGGNGYGFSEKFYDSDWTVDAAHIYIGDPPDVVANIIQETGSIVAPITGSQIDEIGGKSVFSEADPTGSFTPIDHTLLHIEENIRHEGELLREVYELPNGEEIERYYYPDGVNINHVLGAPFTK